MSRISQQLVITQLEDGSHRVSCQVYDKESFPDFVSYITGLGFIEHWLDRLPIDLVKTLKSNDDLVDMDEPVVTPSEVFSEGEDMDSV